MSVTGTEELTRNMQKMAERYGKAVADALFVSGKVVEGDAKRSIQTQSAGDTVTRYRSGGGSYQHVVSSPNSAPNTDTGALVRSITTEVISEDVFVMTGLEYAPHLEFGTINMQPRPFLNPALEKNRRRISKLISDAMKKTTNKGIK